MQQHLQRQSMETNTIQQQYLFPYFPPGCSRIEKKYIIYMETSFSTSASTVKYLNKLSDLYWQKITMKCL